MATLIRVLDNLGKIHFLLIFFFVWFWMQFLMLLYAKRFNFLIVKSSFILQNFVLHMHLLILTHRGIVDVIYYKGESREMDVFRLPLGIEEDSL